MDFIALLMLAGFGALTVAVAARVAAVMRADESMDVTIEEDEAIRELGHLTEEKHTLMAMIRMTDLDHSTGKISEDDRKKTIRRLERETVRVMKRIEQIRGSEEDRDAAAEIIESHVEANHGPTDADREWSRAARLRHGGHIPGTEPAE